MWNSVKCSCKVNKQWWHPVCSVQPKTSRTTRCYNAAAKILLTSYVLLVIVLHIQQQIMKRSRTVFDVSSWRHSSQIVLDLPAVLVVTLCVRQCMYVAIDKCVNISLFYVFLPSKCHVYGMTTSWLMSTHPWWLCYSVTGQFCRSSWPAGRRHMCVRASDPSVDWWCLLTST